MQAAKPHRLRVVPGHPRLWWAAGVAAIALAIALLLWAAPNFTVGAAVRGAMRIAGYDLSYARLDVHAGNATVIAPHVVTLSGEPVLDADRIELEYRLRDLLPGGTHAFGLVAARLYNPTVTIIHHRDGGYNIALPRSGPGANTSAAAPNWNASLFVRNGTIAIIDTFRLYPASRRQRIEGLTADVHLAPDRPGGYHVALTIVEGQTRFPIAGEATIDPLRGYVSHHWTAAQLPLGPLVDYVINSPAVHLESGLLHALNVRYYGLANAAGVMNYHLAGTGYFDRGKLYLGQLAKPLREVNGPLDIVDDGFVFPNIGAVVNSIPIRLTGGIYHFADPSFRLAVRGRGDIARLAILAQSPPPKRVTGALDFGLLIEGPALNPVLLATFSSAGIVYDNTPLRALRGKIAILGTDLHVFDVRTTYGPIHLRAGGVIALRKEAEPQLVVDADVPADALPYGAALAPHLPLHAVATIEGTASHARTQGYLSGATANETIAGVFHLDGRGSGTIGPLAIRRSNGASLYGRVSVDRVSGAMVGYAALHNFSLQPGGVAQLPGATARLPRIAGTFDANIGFGAAKGNVLANGDVHASRAQIEGVTIDDVAATFDVNAGELNARGRYRGSLDRLAALGGLDARGSVDAPFLVSGDRGNFVAQIDSARFNHATLRGVPVTALNATVGMQGDMVRVYAADAHIGGGDLTASGNFGSGGQLALSTSGVEASALHAAGLPLQRGTIAGIAMLGGTAALPQLIGTVALSDSTYAGTPLSGDADLALRGGALQLDAQSVIAGAYAQVKGGVSGVGTGPGVLQRYDLNAHVVGLNPKPFMHNARGMAATVVASVDSDAHIGGTGSAPLVSGEVRIPVGSVNGLGFRNARAMLTGGADAFALRGGSVVVGTTQVAFDARLAGRAQSMALHAAHATLADFNDFFDPADTLAGSGSVDVALQAAGNALATSGTVMLHDFRYRRLPLGETRAVWSHAANTVRGSLDVAGKAGNLHVAGTIAAPLTDPMRDTIRRSNLNVAARAVNADLAVLLPALGYGTPATGMLNADATVRGHYPALLIAANASLEHGTYGRIPIDRLAIATREDGRRTTISSAVLEIPGATTTLSGSFGFGDREPLALAAHVTSSDLRLLAQRSLGEALPLGGTLDATVHLNGTRAQPVVAGTLEMRNASYGKLSVPRIAADVRYATQRLTVANAEADLPRGRVVLSGDMPLGRQLADDPLALALRADNADLAFLAPLLPIGTRLGGIVNGTTRVGGTFGNPELAGGLALNGGSYSSPAERTAITKIGAQVAFSGHEVRLTNGHANAGGGTIDVSGQAALGDLRRISQTLTFRVDARANQARFDLPAYYTGQIDAATSVVREAGVRPTVMGRVMLSNGIVPFTALYNPHSAGPNLSVPTDIGFNLNVDLGSNLRVRSPNVDVGGTGSLALAGTLAAPTLAGTIRSTGGTIDFMRTFRLERGVVSFDPADGIMPDVRAVATTHVTNPDTDVTLRVTGRVPTLQLALSSDAGYSREQLLGLLVNAQSLGAVQGITAAPGGGFSVAQEAFGLLNEQFTRNLLTPLGNQLGTALGFSTFELSTDLSNGGGLGFRAARKLGRHLSLSFAENATPPQRESIALQAHPNNSTVVQFSVFSQRGQAPFINSTASLFTNTSNPTLTATEPKSGTGGFEFSFQRRYR